MGNIQKSYKNECNEVIAMIDQYNNKYRKRLISNINTNSNLKKLKKINKSNFMDNFTKTEKNYFKKILPKIVSEMISFSYKSESNWRSSSEVKLKRNIDLKLFETISDLTQDNPEEEINLNMKKNKYKSLENAKKKHDLKIIFDKIKLKKTDKKHTSKIKNTFNSISNLLTNHNKMDYYETFYEKAKNKSKSLQKIKKLYGEYQVLRK